MDVLIKRDASRERDRERSRRGDRPSRFSDGNRERSRDRGEVKKSGNITERRIYVSNIPYEYRWQELKDLFRSQVGEVAFVELFVDENDKPRGCGIVEFESAELVQKAMEIMHRFDINGRKLVIKEDFGNERDKFGRVVRAGVRRDDRDRMPDLRDEILINDQRIGPINWDNRDRRGDQQGRQDSYNTYGLSTTFLEGLGITGPLHTRVFVANLDYKVDAKKLKEVFRLAGKVQNVDLSVDKDGNSRGFAVIEFDHPVESVQAISMLDRQMLYDRKITVRMDRVSDKSEVLRLPEGLKSIGIGLGPNGEPLRDVARNLPQNNNSGNSQSIGPGPGPGLLGAVPGGLSGLGSGLAAAALSNVVGGNLAGLSSIQGLAGLTNPLLASGLNAGDLGALGLSASLANANLANLGAANLANNIGGSNLGPSSMSNNMNSLSTMPNIPNSVLSTNMNNSQSSNYLSNTSTNTPSSNSNYQSRDFDNMSNSNMRNYNTTTDNDFRSQGGMYGSIGNQQTGRNVPNNSANMPSNQGSMSQTLMQEGQNNNSGNRSNLSDTILVNNLPPTCTWQFLRDRFRDIGDIKYAEMRGKDAGIVRFVNEWDAQRAIKVMDGSRIDGRTINIEFY